MRWAGIGTAGLLIVHAAPAVVDWVRLSIGARSAEMGELEWFSLAIYEPWFLTGGILLGVVERLAR